MLASEVLDKLSASGVRLRREGAALLATPSKGALTDELRSLIRDHKPELLNVLADVAPSPLTGLDCSGCGRLEMREEVHPGSRRRFWWRCTKDHALLEARRYGARVIVSPPECEQAGDFVKWGCGQ